MYPVLVWVPLGIITISTFHASMATQEEPRVEAPIATMANYSRLTS